MMSSDSNSTSSEYFLYQESRTGIKRYFCCFFIKHKKGNYLKQNDKQEEKNKLVPKENLEEDHDEIDDYLPSWSINEVHKISFHRRSSNNSDLKTVRFDTNSF